MKKMLVVMVCMTLLVLYACTSYRNYTMEVLRPGLVTPTTINDKLIFVNNTIPQPAEIGQYYMGLDHYGMDTTYNIPCRVDTFFDLLVNYLTIRIEKEGLIKSVEKLSVKDEGISNKVKNQQDAYLRFGSLDKKQRSHISKQTTASMMASLDGLLLESLESCEQESGTFPMKRWVFVRSVWSVYDTKKDSLLDQFQRRDSLYWSVPGSTAPRLTIKPMPSLESTLPEIADYVAGEVYHMFTPYWQPIERFYYITGNMQLKLAADEVRVGNWDVAADYWQYVYKSGSGLNPYRASVNMMLYCERNGDVPGALMWANRADIASRHDILTPSYEENVAFNAWYRDLNLRQEEMKRILPYLD